MTKHRSTDPSDAWGRGSDITFDEFFDHFEEVEKVNEEVEKVNEASLARAKLMQSAMSVSLREHMALLDYMADVTKENEPLP